MKTENNENRKEKTINDFMTVESPKVKCPRCEFIFKVANRCTNCGQLIFYK